MRGLFFFMLSLENLQTSNSDQEARPRGAPKDPPSSTDRTKLKGLRKGYIPYMLFGRRSRRSCGISFVSTISIFFFFHLTLPMLFFISFLEQELFVSISPTFPLLPKYTV